MKDSVSRAKHRDALLPIIVFFGILSFVSIYTFATNVHGDGMIQGLVAKEIVETGRLQDHLPFRIMDIDGLGITYAPIPYPELSHVFMSLFYMSGGMEFLQFSSPLVAATIGLFVYLLVRHINKYAAAAAALLAIFLNTQRFIMVPLMEQFLLLGMMISIFTYYRFFQNSDKRYLLLAAVSLGVVLATKQQGLIFALVIATHLLLFGAFRFLMNSDRSLLRKAVPLLIIASAVSLAPLIDQVTRNGTVLGVPIDTTLPFLEPKYTTDPEAVAEVNSIIGYFLAPEPIYRTAERAVLQPAYFYRSNLITGLVTGEVLFTLVLFAAVLVAGGVFLLRRDLLLFSIFIPLLAAEIITANLAQTRFFQYHNLFLTLYAIMLVFGLLQIARLIHHRRVRKRKLRRLVRTFPAFVSLLLVGLIVVGFNNLIHEPLYGSSGRQSDQNLAAHAEMCRFIQQETSNDEIFLASEIELAYCERSALWLTYGGGAKVPFIFATTNESAALEWLGFYNITYLLIHKDQVRRRGVYDYIPSTGLLTYIDSSLNFELLYGAPSEEPLLKLYRVLGG